MMKPVLVYAMAFGLSAALGAAGSGCIDLNCDCPQGPPLPSRLTPQRLSSVSLDTDGSTSIDLHEATMEIDGAQLYFRYVQGGVSFEVTYDIFPNP